jgi:hypothetical protein
VVNTVHQGAGAAGVSLVGAAWFTVGPFAALGVLAGAAVVTVGLLGLMGRTVATPSAGARLRAT